MISTPYSKNILHCAVASVVALSQFSDAAENRDSVQLEEIVVTGTHIRGSSIDSASPVAVIDRSDISYSGSPTLNEIIRTLGVSSGVEGEPNQFGVNGLEGTSNVNLRGLGAGRTLVLLNGRRQTFSPRSINDQKMFFVDTNHIPSVALERMEILKDGAAATYGSDAIAGVVNFITRKDFTGFEMNGSYKMVEDSDGDHDLGAIWGWENETTNVVTSVGYNHRSKLTVRDRDFSLVSYEDNPQGGWSNIGNPVTIVRADQRVWVPDPNCDALGGRKSGVVCQFQYLEFDNLVEDEDRYQVFSELTHNFSETSQLHAEVLYARTDIDNWRGSPSYPPQELVDAENRRVLSDHPGWVDMQAQFPSLDSLDDSNPYVLYMGRVVGVTGPGGPGSRSSETWRVASNLTGTFDNGWHYDGGFAWSRAQQNSVTTDTQVHKLRQALLGLGGGNCSGNTPGVNGCEYYNPFSNAIEVSGVNGLRNPSYNPAVANSPEILSWLRDKYEQDFETELFTADFTISGELDWKLGGGPVGFATGVQYREESAIYDPNDLADLSLNPCIEPGETSCSSPSGLFGFLSSSDPADEDQEIFALYGELALPLRDDLDMQLAVRYEDYGGSVGHTIDPKVAVRWQINEQLALRASASTTFRGPTVNQLSGTSVALSYVSQARGFKAIETIGNPDLEPEEATTFNVGVIGEFMEGKLFATLDYWSFDFEGPIIVEPHFAVLNKAIAGEQPFVDQVHLGTPGNFSTVQRIDANIVNGPDIKTAGVDLFARFSPNETWSIGTEFTYTSKYDVGSTDLFDSFSAVGQLNTSNFSRPLPRLKGKIYSALDWEQHNVNLTVNYIHDYKDERESLFGTYPQGETIDKHVTADLNYNYKMPDRDTLINLSLVNLTDEEPPFARLDLSYDPFTHNSLGRTLKFTVTHKIW